MGQIRQISALEETIGRKSLEALTVRFAGQRIYVPWNKHESLQRFRDNFAPLVGHSGVTKLVDCFGGMRITVPTGRSAIGRKAKKRVAERLQDMQLVVELTEVKLLTATQISVILECDPRTVHRLRSQARKLGMFRTKHKRKRR